MVLYYKNSHDLVEQVLKKVGMNVVVAAPLGIGKPVQFLNALYREAKKNSQITLKIFTALSLIKPDPKHKIAKRLLEPILERLYSNYEDLEYEIDRRNQCLPSNVKIIEFYFSQGHYLNNFTAQQDYISSNYSHVIRDLVSYGINVVAQLICQDAQSKTFSLGCNADLAHELYETVKYQDKKPIFIGELNQNMPYMHGEDAFVTENNFDYILQPIKQSSLFVIPRPPISEAEFMIGIYGSALIQDDGCLQIGIGSLGESLCASLIFRHKNNEEYLKFLEHINLKKKFNHIVLKLGETNKFTYGLFASSEMLVDGFIDLFKNNILRKKVYDNSSLQFLLNHKLISENITSNILDILLKYDVISSRLNEKDFLFLQKYGIFKPDLKFKNGNIITKNKDKILADLSHNESKAAIIAQCLGTRLQNGRIAHAGFFIGSQSLYNTLQSFTEDEIKLFDMRLIKKINHLYGAEQLARNQKTKSRFFNSSMKITLLGGVISDTIENGIVVSGVGGQYNFVSMAHELKDGRSIVKCRSTYIRNRRLYSNIIWENGNLTIPRHLRDIVITEYGIADCRSKTDSEVIKELLNITDSRFQKKLLKCAKKFGKIERDYKIPEKFQNNYPNVIKKYIQTFKHYEVYKRYPFGTDLTKEEIICEKALTSLKNASYFQLIFYFIKGFFVFGCQDYLKRLNLDKPQKFSDLIYKILLKGVRA